MTPDDRSAADPAPRRGFNDVRAPLMMIYVLAFCGGRVAAIPIWALLLVTSGLIAAVALLFERRALAGMLSARVRPLVVGVLVAPLLHVLIAFALQAASSLSFADGAALDDGSPPAVFRLMVELKRHLHQIPLPIAALGGALLLAPAEGLFWRGFVQLRLVIWTGAIPGVVLTAALYGGLYAVMLGPLAAGVAALSGLAFSILTQTTRTLAPAVIAHAILWLLGAWLVPLV